MACHPMLTHFVFFLVSEVKRRQSAKAVHYTTGAFLFDSRSVLVYYESPSAPVTRLFSRLRETETIATSDYLRSNSIRGFIYDREFYRHEMNEK